MGSHPPGSAPTQASRPLVIPGLVGLLRVLWEPDMCALFSDKVLLSIWAQTGDPPASASCMHFQKHRPPCGHTSLRTAATSWPSHALCHRAFAHIPPHHSHPLLPSRPTLGFLMVPTGASLRDSIPASWRGPSSYIGPKSSYSPHPTHTYNLAQDGYVSHSPILQAGDSPGVGEPASQSAPGQEESPSLLTTNAA